MSFIFIAAGATTATAVAATTAVVGIGIGAFATIEQGRAAERQGDFQSKIAARNAEQARRDAEGKRQAAAEAAVQRERRGRELKGKQVAGFAKAGVSLRGSPLSVLVQTAQDIEADRLTILREGAIASSTDEFRAGIIEAEGSAAKARGKAAKRGSVLSAVGGAASGIGSVGLKTRNP